MNIVKFAAGVAALALIAGGAHASTSFSDNFNGEDGGATQLDYTGFANFNVTGTVDLISSGAYGITCEGGSGSCVDLAGDTAGELVSKNSYAFNTGSVVTLSFDVSGNQRSGNYNTFTGGFLLPGGAVVSDFTLGGAWGPSVSPGPFLISSVIQSGATTGGSQPFENYTFSFTADQAGTVFFLVETQDNTNVGPVLDNVSWTITDGRGGVPEPATWAMMLMGFGALGGTLRAARRTGYQAA